MNTTHLLGAAALAVVAAISISQRPAGADLAAAAATPPTADGHYVLVVEGDRDALDVTFASRKPAPWAGPKKGLQTGWQLTVLDANGAELAEVPLDVRPFATDAASKGQPDRVEGCVVVSAKIGMLVSAPRYAAAAAYRFSRTDAPGAVTVLGEVSGARVRQLSGGGR
jgi:hypothetical protein